MTAASLSSVGSTPALSGVATQDDDKLKKAAKGFEAVFVRQLLKEVRESGFSDDDMTNNSAVEQFQEMSDARTADTMADRGTFGIAKSLIAQLGPKQAAAAYSAANAKGAAE